MVMVMNDLLPPLCNVSRPSHSEIQLFQNLTMKIHGQGNVCGQRSRSYLTFKIQRSRLWSRSNPLIAFEAWSSVDMFAFHFMAIGPFFSWDIANSIFDLENSRSRSWPRSNPMVTFEPKSSIDMFAFVSWQDHFWLRYSKFHIWPWKIYVKVMTKIDQNLIR